MATQTRAKLTSKYQATIPEPVRKALGLQAGDMVVYEVKGSQVVLRREIKLDKEYLEALTDTLSEWNSEADEAAYGNL